ncbi:MAG: hypothetical protein EOP36_20420 [Rubrivivax sp.]|nr:MAG: hypothetical protein EOP36_20420 [Rubrivivax sp.]
MIARVHTKTQPIPFNSQSLPDHEAQVEPRAAVPLATVSWVRPTLATHKISTATTVRRTAMNTATAPVPTPSMPTPRRTTELNAKYLGGGNLSVRSSVTGRHYRFEGHGATLRIDSRDQLMLRRIPELLIS